MADRRPPEPLDDTTGAPGGAAGMPRWVKVSLIVVMVLALVFVITRLAGVQHGPGLHGPGGGGGPTPSVAHTPPAEHQP